VCDSNELKLFLDLGEQPWCNDFILPDQIGREERYPLKLFFCDECTTVQISYNVNKETMYSDHVYLSGVTSTMRHHFQTVTDRLVQDIGKYEGLVVDIGSNDGTLLSTFNEHHFKAVGVEPCARVAELANENGIETLVRYFNKSCSDELRADYGPATIISAANVFYHVEELHSVVAGVSNLLDKDGVFLIQGSYLPDIMKNNAFDVMYHEHLLYYRYETLSRLLEIHGLEIFNVYRSTVHGGSIIAYVGHKGRWTIDDSIEVLRREEHTLQYDKFSTYQEFGRKILELKGEILSMVMSAIEAGKTIYAFGAPAKGTVLLNYCGLTRNEIPYAVEKNPLKIGRFIPGTEIEIVEEGKLQEPYYYFLLSWNFLTEFTTSPQFQNGRRKFLVPIPYPRIVSA